jgi:CheY-like chemotaxis protein
MKRGFTLLLAEDDENDVIFFKTALEESSKRTDVPVRLVVAPDGAQALEYLKGEGDFSDRTKHPFPDIIVFPKIMLSGSKQQSDVDEAYRLGANTFFQKPVSLREFHELVYHIVCNWAHTQRPVIKQSVT